MIIYLIVPVTVTRDFVWFMNDAGNNEVKIKTMKKGMSYSESISTINKFLLNANKRDIEIRFLERGYYMKIKKHTRKKEVCEIELHTPGYDGCLPLSEALSWIEWTLRDYHANGIC